jgi:hypothetical protein
MKFYLARDNHKLIAEFEEPHQIVRFGAKGYNDYTTFHQMNPVIAEHKKLAYLRRHRKNEDWEDPRTPGALSRWILWNKPTIEESILNFKKRFNL